MAKYTLIEHKEEINIEDCDLDKLEKLQSYLRCQNLEQVLKFTKDGVKATSWVGVIKYKNIQFQILPKLISDDEEDCNSIIKNLVFMLSYTRNLDIKTTDNSQLSNSKNPFIEILIREYCNSLFDCLKRLTPKKYVREEDNLNYLKGKVKFSENIRYNCANRAKFYCEFDEFSENNILNQLFLFVSTCLYNISNENNNKKILRLIINYYSDIKLVSFDKFKVNKIKLSKNQELFRKPFYLAKMFVEKTSVDLSKNKFENITLVWDMNKLFEEFIFETMRRNKPDNVKLKAQKGKKLLVNDNSKKRNTFVDILIEKDKTKYVLDTKYKEFNYVDDFTNSDIFQVSTYCLLHKSKKSVLIYPKVSFNIANNEDDKKEYAQISTCFYLNTDDYSKNKTEENQCVRFLCVDLKQKLTANVASQIGKEMFELITKE